MKLEKNLNSLSLDSGGILYPYIATKSWAQGFRMEARLDETVDYDTLLQAVDRGCRIILSRCPKAFCSIGCPLFKNRRTS